MVGEEEGQVGGHHRLRTAPRGEALRRGSTGDTCLKLQRRVQVCSLLTQAGSPGPGVGSAANLVSCLQQ